MISDLRDRLTLAGPRLTSGCNLRVRALGSPQATPPEVRVQRTKCASAVGHVRGHQNGRIETRVLIMRVRGQPNKQKLRKVSLRIDSEDCVGLTMSSNASPGFKTMPAIAKSQRIRLACGVGKPWFAPSARRS